MSHILWVTNFVKFEVFLILTHNGLFIFTIGDFGGVRASALIQPFLNELGMISLPVRVALPTVHTKFDSEGQPTDTRFQDNVQRMVDELVWYADALNNQKTTSGNVPK